METQTNMVPTPVGELAVRVVGAGRPTVLWQSLFVDERSWERIEPHLGQDRQLVSITGPGHGRSGDPGRLYTMEDCVQAARVVLDSLDITAPVDWVGNAWGGHVGIMFATRWPERCRTLVTVGTPAQPLNAKERLATRFLLLAHRLVGPVGLITNGVAEKMLSRTTRERDAAAVAYLAGCITSADRATLRRAVVSTSLHRDDLLALLPSVQAPTLFITGADHVGWTPTQAEAASGLLPRGSCAVIPDAAYLAPLEAPAETARLIRLFWAAHPDQAAA